MLLTDRLLVSEYVTGRRVQLAPSTNKVCGAKWCWGIEAFMPELKRCVEFCFPCCSSAATASPCVLVKLISCLKGVGQVAKAGSPLNSDPVT